MYRAMRVHKSVNLLTAFQAGSQRICVFIGPKTGVSENASRQEGVFLYKGCHGHMI